MEPLRVTLLVRAADGDEPTPKLRSVARWLARVEDAGDADWDSVVWIDDVLGPDAREWAHGHHQPVLLEKPAPDQGLTEAHVIAVEVFVADGERGVEGPAPEDSTLWLLGPSVILLQGDAAGCDLGGRVHADEAQMPRLIGVAVTCSAYGR